VTHVERIPPQSLEAEATVLGAALIDPEAFDVAADILRPQHFYAHVHESIFGVMLDLRQGAAPVEVLSVADELRDRDALERCGGIAYLRSLTDTVQTASSVAYYAGVVREKALLRGLIHAGGEIATAGYEGDDDVQHAIGYASKALNAVIETAAPKRAVKMIDALKRHDERAKRGNVYLTPWPKLDRLTSGFTGDELVVWAGETGVGKSFLENMLAAYVAEHYGAVAIFATEMGEFKTVERLIALYSGVSTRRQRENLFAERGESSPFAKPFDKWEAERVFDARVVLELLPIYVFDGSLSSDEIVSQCRRLHREVGLRSVFVDTLGAVAEIATGAVGRGEPSTHERQKRAVSALKALSGEIDAPVHVAHHLSRPDSRGVRSAKERLRDGGNLENIATTFIEPHREIVDSKRVYHLIVHKARDGDDGMKVKMRFVGSAARWFEEGQERLWLDPATPQEITLEEAALDEAVPL
jgi:replicative DNA helicase